MSSKSTNKSHHKTKESNRINLEAPPHCPYCNSDDVYGISRVVGYFSVIDNWNYSKQAEFKRRQKGNYWSEKLE